MNFPVVLDIAIGIVVIYIISSMIMSFIMEFIIVRRNWKGDFLYEKLKDMFYSSQGGYYNIIEKVYRHPLITKVQQYSYRRPEKIESHTFAQAFMHVMTEIGEETTDSKDTPQQDDLIDRAVTKSKYLDGDGLRIVQSLFLSSASSSQKSNVSAEELHTQRMNNIKEWYEDFQSRLDYLFKREVKWYIFIFSFILCALMNIDTIGIYNKLSKSAKLRDKIVLMGEKMANQSYEELKFEKDSILRKTSILLKNELTKDAKNIKLNDRVAVQKLIDKTIDKSLKNLEKAQGDLFEGANDLIGWNKVELNDFQKSKGQWTYWLFKICGLMISAFALMFGAPFWHDYLKSMLAIRNIIQPKAVLK